MLSPFTNWILIHIHKSINYQMMIYEWFFLPKGEFFLRCLTSNCCVLLFNWRTLRNQDFDIMYFFIISMNLQIYIIWRENTIICLEMKIWKIKARLFSHDSALSILKLLLELIPFFSLLLFLDPKRRLLFLYVHLIIGETKDKFEGLKIEEEEEENAN